MEAIQIRKNLGHVMVDVESLGRRSGSVITSIGAVEFDLNTGQTGREFYVNIDIQSCLDLGMTVEGVTIQWWFEQPSEFQKTMFKDTVSLSKALHLFTMFIEECGGKKVEVWGNSPRFDMGKLTDAYYFIKKQIPWNFKLERDVRTLVMFNPNAKYNHNDLCGVSHNPVEDCKGQISYCHKIYKTIKIKTIIPRIHPDVNVTEI